MSAPPLRRLKIDMGELASMMQFRQSGTLEEQTPYLDTQTGEIIWVFESDDDYADTMNADPQENAELREQVEQDPDRFIDLPELDASDDNDMLREFLRSNWTEDESLRRKAEDAYRGSVGRWKRAIGHDRMILDAWRDFEDNAARRRALEFLAEYGIEPEDAAAR